MAQALQPNTAGSLFASDGKTHPLPDILMAVTLYRLARHGRWQAAACLLVVLFYGYMETQVIHITSDPALLLLVPAVFGDSLSD